MKNILKNITKYLSKNWKKVLIGAILLLIGFLIFKKVTTEPKGLESYIIQKGEILDSFSANGEVAARKEVTLKFYSPGKVSWVGVKEGDNVKAWQGVASLDAVALNASYQIALNNLRNNQANAEYVLDNVKDHSSDENFQTKAERTAAEVMRDNAYDSVLAARDNLQNAALVSPISGTVVNTNNLVAGINLTGADLESKYIKVVDLKSLYFKTEVDEIDFSKVKLGQEVLVSLDAYLDKTCSGKVARIGQDGNKSAGGVVTIPVEVEFNEGCGINMVSNLSGQANFVMENKGDVISVPRKYLVEKNGKNYVWKQTGKSTRNRKLVEVNLGLSNSSEVEITSGLESGDTVIYLP